MQEIEEDQQDLHIQRLLKRYQQGPIDKSTSKPLEATTTVVLQIPKCIQLNSS